MARPEAPFYVGSTRPSSIGWTRIIVTLVAGAALVAVMSTQARPFPPVLILAAALVFVGLAFWTWIGQWTRFIVDEHGVTVSLGGFWPQRPWPLADFRAVQLRQVPQSTVGVTVGGFGWRRGRVMGARPEELRPVGRGKVFTTDDVQRRTRILVTRSGTLVEIVGRGGTDYLLSPTDPVATADAVEQAIRARR